MVAFVIIFIFVSPLILGPLVIPRMYESRERELLARLEEPVLKNIAHGYHLFRDREWMKDRCDRSITICCSERVCGGKLVDIEEHFVTDMKEAGKSLRTGPVVVSIGMLCLRCGHFNTRGRRSYLFKGAYTYVKSVDQFVALLEDHRRKVDLKVNLPTYGARKKAS